MHRTRSLGLAFVSLFPIASLAPIACGGAETLPPSNVATVTSASAPSASSVASTSPLPPGIDESTIDPSVAPCDDFYAHACGGWLASTPIPADKSAWGRGFSVLGEKTASTMRDILEHAAGQGDADNPYAKAIGDLYASCIDEGGIEARKLGDAADELSRIAKVKDAASLAKAVAHHHAIGIASIFFFDSEIDQKDATRVIGGVTQAGLSLPDRDYYVKDDAPTKEMRAKLEAHVVATLTLVGELPAEAKAHAAAVMRVETALAQAQMGRVEQRDPDKIYHRLERAGLAAAAPAFQWSAYFDEIGYANVDAINVAQPEYAKAFGAMVKSVPMADWRAYLRWRVVDDAAPALAKSFVDENFRFRQNFTGAKQIEPRWRRCVRAVEGSMSEAVGRSFAKTTLGPDGKATVESMVDGLLAAMNLDIEQLAWMDPPTRAKAKAKLAAFTKKIGYPDKWRAYDALKIDRAAYLGNVWRAQAFEAKRSRDKIGRPVDRSEWAMPPSLVNAQYEPTFNDITFPAAILQLPYFGRERSPAVNFGAIGMVMGHEVTHGFDDEGRKFDADGSRRDWWTAAAGTEFDKRAQCVVDQYDAYAPLADKHVDGKLTLGENIADLGGVKIALMAMRSARRAKPSNEKFARSDEQLFFYGYAQVWCQNMRDERLRVLLTVDPHSPAKYRVNGPLSNTPEFAATFGCSAGSKMVRAQRCDIW